MRKFAHIINPFKASPHRDIYIAQPIVFESLKRSRDYLNGRVAVELLTTQYQEDRDIIPDHFTILDDLDRAFVGDSDQDYKLPFISDILDKAFEAIPDADYIIHSETDIGLMPYFYDAVDELINEGYDSIIINCRYISNKYTSKNELPLMWSEVGEKHPGWDCFIFRKDVYKKYILGNTIVGANSIGRALFINLKYYAEEFIEMTDSHLTFHLGKSQHLVNLYNPNKDPFGYKCNLHNEKEVIKIIDDLLKNNNGENKGWLMEWRSDCQKRLERYLSSVQGNKNKKYPGYWRYKNIKEQLGFKID